MATIITHNKDDTFSLSGENEYLLSSSMIDGKSYRVNFKISIEKDPLSSFTSEELQLKIIPGNLETYLNVSDSDYDMNAVNRGIVFEVDIPGVEHKYWAYTSSEIDNNGNIITTTTQAYVGISANDFAGLVNPPELPINLNISWFSPYNEFINNDDGSADVITINAAADYDVPKISNLVVNSTHTSITYNWDFEPGSANNPPDNTYSVIISPYIKNDSGEYIGVDPIIHTNTDSNAPSYTFYPSGSPDYYYRAYIYLHYRYGSELLESDYIALKPLQFYIKTNNGWKESNEAYIKTANGWSSAKQIFFNTSDGWKEI